MSITETIVYPVPAIRTESLAPEIILSLHLNGTNGYHKESAPTHQPYEPQYRKKFSDEDLVELSQGQQLSLALQTKPYKSAEAGSDEILDGRRPKYDVYSPWKWSDLHVKRYNQVMAEIKSSGMEVELLSELLNRWTTPTNILELAHLLEISQHDIQSIESLRNSTVLPQVPDSGVDKTEAWYQKLLDVLAEDDIVPLVVMRQLILETGLKPSITKVFRGLLSYYARAHHRLRMSNDDMDEKVIRLKNHDLQKAEQSDQIMSELKLLAK